MFYSRVKQLADSSGLNDFVFATHPADTNFKTWLAVVTNGAKILCCADDGSDWEVSYGTWNSSSKTIVGRTFVDSSTNAKVNFAHAPTVFSDFPGFYAKELDTLLNLFAGILDWRARSGIMLGKGYIGATLNNAICIGIGNDSGTYGVLGENAIAIGFFSSANGLGAIAFGTSATVNDSGVAIGYSATSVGSNSFAMGPGTTSGGANSLAVGSFSSNSGEGAISIGNYSQVLGARAIGLGGDGNNEIIVSHDGAIGIGALFFTEFKGHWNFVTGAFDSIGDAGNGGTSLRTTTIDATATELGVSDGTLNVTPTDRVAMSDNAVYFYELSLIARKSPSGTDYKAWKIYFAISRESGAASTALIGTVTKTLIGASVGAATWDVAVTADVTNGRPAIKVTGQASTTIRWNATAQITKVAN